MLQRGYSTPAPKFCLAANVVSPDDGVGDRCTIEQLRLNPKSVEAPCDARLADRALSDDERAKALYVRAEGYHQTLRPGLAGDDYESAIALDPSNADFHVSYGWLLHSSGLHAAAVSEALNALTLDPRSARALDLSGFLKWREGDPEGAVARYSQALSIDPSLTIARYHRANLLFDLARYREALPDVDQLVALSPEAASRAGLFNATTMAKVNINAVALLLRGRIYNQLNEFESAERDFKEALAQARSSEVLTWFGAMLERKDSRRAEAMGYLREAISLRPKYFVPHYYYGLALSYNMEFDAALEEYNTTINIAPDYFYAYFERALALKSLGQTERAVHDLEIAMWGDKNAFDMVMSNLRMTRYWTRSENPTTSSQELRDSLTACVIDPHCI
jgi:tetratricopeptide (TPR) repeat protein